MTQCENTDLKRNGWKLSNVRCPKDSVRNTGLCPEREYSEIQLTGY
jgi:hypothetical protein